MSSPRCEICYLRQTICVCAQIQQISLPMQLIIIRHHKEVRKPSNSARTLYNSIQNCSMYTYGEQHSVFPDIRAYYENAALLFPITESTPPSVNYHPENVVPKCLIIVDGSWRQATRIVKRISGLEALPRMNVRPATNPLPKIRHPHFAEGMSTMEAGIEALRPYIPATDLQILEHNYLYWIEEIRKSSGLQETLEPGMSFRMARLAEQSNKQSK